MAVEKVHQRRSRDFVVLTYSVYAPCAKFPAALLAGLFEQPHFLLTPKGVGELSSI
ncbi:MAG: hypothetical protein O7F12_04265 [Nitrospirae bacterium]|nr:hypothetical protein [Nitrospirota bacterium]